MVMSNKYAYCLVGEVLGYFGGFALVGFTYAALLVVPRRSRAEALQDQTRSELQR